MRFRCAVQFALLVGGFLFNGPAAGIGQQDTIESLKRQLAKNPKSPELHYNLGVNYHKLMRLEEAAASYARAIELKPDFFRAHFNLGVIRASQGRFLEAVEMFEAVQRLEPGFAPVRDPLAAAVLFLKADTALAQKRYDEAVRHFEEYLRLNPGDPFATPRLQRAKLGQAYEKARQAERSGDWEAALRIYEKMDSNYADIRERLANMRRRLQPKPTPQPSKPVAAEESSTKPKEERPELARRYQKALEALRQEDLQAAVEGFEWVVEEQPDYRDAASRLKTARARLSREIRRRYDKGIVHLERKELAAAEAAFRQALDLDSRHVGAKAGRLVVAGWSALESGDAIEAEAQARAALLLVDGFAPAESLRRAAEERLRALMEAEASEPDSPLTEVAAGVGAAGEEEPAADPGGGTQAATKSRVAWLIWGPIAGVLLLGAALTAVVMRRRRRPAEPGTGTAPYVSSTEVIDELVGPAPASAPQSPADIGRMTQISRYELKGEVGRGAMGVVFKAWDPKLDRTVVLKTIRFDVLSDLIAELSDAKQRFFREARAAGRLNHPNIVTVYDVAEDQDVWFIVMEYIEGETLGQILSRERVLPVQRVIHITKQVCSALEYAHSNGVIHRDIKPSNIMVMKEDKVKVMDFGIAKLSASTMTSTGSLIGTASYMSPEQISGRQVDGRSDIFSAGIVTYELITGQRPFQGETIPTLMYEILNHEPTPPTRLNPSITPLMDEIIGKALAKEPDERYASAKELYDDLERAAQGYLIEAIMVVDICDSSRIAEKYGNRFAERLFDKFRAITNDCLEQHRPSFVKDTGDGVMATFPSVHEAVQAAVQFEQCLAQHNESVADKERIHTRVGIHFGETRVAGFGDRHSADVNIAFRVQGLSRDEFIEEPGGLKRKEVPERDRVFITQQVYEELQGASDFKTRPIGFFEMKNIYGRHKIYEVVWSA